MASLALCREAPPGATCHRYADLAAEVLVGALPGDTERRLESLYGTVFTTLDWLEVHEGVVPDGVVELAGPAHLIPFSRDGATVRLHLRTAAIAPAEVVRARDAVFRAFPAVRRVLVETQASPRELPGPKVVRGWTDDMVVHLPATLDAYLASLGRSTRANLQAYERRLRRDHPDTRTAVFAAGERSRELFDVHLAWKRERFRRKGLSTYWDEHPDKAAQFVELLRRRGQAHLTTVAGRPAAVVFTFPAGAGVNLYAYAFDPAYEYYRLGLLAQYWVIAAAIAAGARRVNLLWGTVEYKRRLGAVPVRNTEVALYRRHADRLRFSDDAALVARRWQRRARERYWELRGAVARRLRTRPASTTTASTTSAPATPETVVPASTAGHAGSASPARAGPPAGNA